jgi:glutathione S-transferase
MHSTGGLYFLINKNICSTACDKLEAVLTCYPYLLKIMITLHQFSPNWGLPNASPFCMKLETYLRMANLPYTVVYEDNLDKAPKGKMPYIKDDGEDDGEDDGKKIGDSNLIIEYLNEKYGDRTDAQLSPSDRGISLAMRRLIEENLYWCMVYSRWIDESNWPITRSAYFGNLPPVVQQILPGLIRKDIRKSLDGHGMGKHSPAEIYAIGCRDLIALSGFLSDKQFFFGDRPTLLDASAYATILNFLKVPMESPLATQAKQLDNLVAFCDRMTARFYPG